MLFLIEALAVMLAIITIVALFSMLYDAERWFPRRRRHQPPLQEEIQALENHPSREDGSEDFD